MLKVVTLLVFVLAGSALAQSGTAENRGPQQPSSADQMATLTAEIRALRAELAEAARANIRLQLLVARLQLQEQRIIYLDRQRSDLAAQRAGVQQQRLAVEAAVKMFAGVPGQDKQFISNFKEQAAAHLAQEQELQARENELLNSLAAEQARWTDLSSRLEELERSLAR